MIDFLLNTVFNCAMDEKTRDQQLINDLGGPSKVAELLGLKKLGGQQRVQNWLERGIPAAVKVARPDLFMPELASNKALSEAAAQSPPSAPAMEAIAPKGWDGVDRRQLTKQVINPADGRREIDRPDGFPVIAGV